MFVISALCTSRKAKGLTSSATSSSFTMISEPTSSSRTECDSTSTFFSSEMLSLRSFSLKLPLSEWGSVGAATAAACS